MKSRILILTGESPDTPGGVEHVIRELTRGLKDRGYDVEVLHRLNSAPEWVARPKNKLQKYSADLALGFYLGRKVKSQMGTHVSAVVSNSLYGCYLPGVPKTVRKIHIYHGTYRGLSKAIRPYISAAGAFKLKWWDSMILERLSGRNKQIICNSDQTRDEVRTYFGHQGSAIWLPMNTDHFRPLDRFESRLKLKINRTDKVGMFAGNTQPTKGFPIVRGLIDLLPEVKWILALRGEIPEDLKTNPRITVFQDASHDLLPSLYNAADFAVCPSLYEAFGYVVAEALSCGTPMVASIGGASSRFLSRGLFQPLLISQPSEVEQFLTGIREILRDSEFYRNSVIEHIRPEIQRVMSTDAWLNHFCELTGL